MFWKKNRLTTTDTNDTPSLEKPKKYEVVSELTYPAKTSPDGHTHTAWRIRALVDIPMHGVKAGDLGGYVQDSYILSHDGSCWVGGDALAARPFETNHWGDRSSLKVVVQQDALVTDKAFARAYVGDTAVIKDNAVAIGRVQGKAVMKDNARMTSGFLAGRVVIAEDASIHSARINGGYLEGKEFVDIGGNISIRDSEPEGKFFISVKEDEKISVTGDASFNNVTIRGDFTFDAEVNLESVSFEGDNTILGRPRIKPNVKFTGRNVISGDSLIPPGSHVHDVCMSGGVLNYGVPLSAGMSPQRVLETGIPSSPGSAVSDDVTEYIAVINQIEAEYESYTTDIVKLIKFPGMADTSIPEVGAFVVKLRSAKRAMKTARADVLASLTEALELAFVNAENRVQTLVASHLDESQKKSLKTAEKMFSIACDEASPEPEKRLGYKAGIRALEGIVLVSDVAKENMKARVGILELEA
jgi:hypothetical protein